MTHTDSDNADVLWACARKKAYPTEDIAKLSVVSINSANPEASVRAYACRRCGLWHVGATPANERKYQSFTNENAKSPVSRERAPRRRSYGDASVRRSRPAPQRARRRDDDD